MEVGRNVQNRFYLILRAGGKLLANSPCCNRRDYFHFEFLFIARRVAFFTFIEIGFATFVSFTIHDYFFICDYLISF